MDNILNELIRTANLLYGNSHSDGKHYSKALEYYKSSLERLFAIRSQQDPQARQGINQVIENILKKAEDCQNLRDGFYEDEVKKLTAVLTPSIPQPVLIPAPKPQTSQIKSAPTPPAQSNQYEELIEQEIIEKSAKIPWDSISGLSLAKSTLQESIIRPTLYPHIYTGLRAPPKGILLFGPPGTGKTLLAKAVASECNATFLNISSSTLTSKNYGDGEKLVRALFSVARKNQPSIVFIDEVDSILGARNESQHEASRRLETEFLIQMDGVGSANEDRILVIAATNRPQELDEAVRRRLTKRIYIPLPDSETRKSLILNLLKEAGTMSEEDVQWVVGATDGYSGSDLSNLCKEAAMDSVRGLSDEDLNSGRNFFVVRANFERGLKVIRPSVQKASLDYYERWNEEFGSR